MSYQLTWLVKNFILTDLIKNMISGLNKRTCQIDYVTNRSHLQRVIRDGKFNFTTWIAIPILEKIFALTRIDAKYVHVIVGSLLL